MRWRWKRKLAVVLSAAMVLSVVNIGPLYASEDDAEAAIVGFEDLEEKYAFQTLPMGAEEADIEFPDELWVDLTVKADGAEEDAEAETATGSNAGKKSEVASGSDADEDDDIEADFDVELVNDLETDVETTIRTKLSDVEWELNAEQSTGRDFRSDAAGVYIYEPVIPDGYEMPADAVLPQIAVSVGISLLGGDNGTGLVDGVLTLTSERGSGTGWDWKNTVLNVNGSFEPNKQIKFIVDTATFKLNGRNAVLSPDDKNPAISASGDLTITSEVTKTDFGNLTVEGSIEAESVTIAGTAKVIVGGDGIELFRLEQGNRLILDGGTISGTTGSSIYLSEGAIVKGVSGVFSDQGEAFLEDGEVTVAAEDTPAAGSQLTAGSYVWDGSKFAKAGSAETESTVLKDGILTITKKAGGVEDEGWNWNGSKLDINRKFTGNKQIVFQPGITPVIQVNSALTIAPDAGNAAVIAAEKLTINVKNENGNITLKGPVEATNITIQGVGKVIADGTELFRLEQGNKLNLDGGTVSSINGGSIYLCEGAIVEGMSGILSDQGKTFTDNGPVTVLAENTPAADNQLTAGTYVGAGNLFTKGGPVETETTELKDGILTVTNAKGNGTGWAWNGEILNVNSQFVNNKQVVFKTDKTPVFQINSGITLAPDAGEPAILANGDLTINAAKNLRLKGAVEAANITVKGAGEVIADGIKLFNIKAGNTLKLEGGILNSLNGGNIYLNEGAKVEGMSGVLSDQGKDFADNGIVTILAANTPAADNQLTAGSYVGAGAVFTKGGTSEPATTGLKDGILTITKEKGSGAGWAWNGWRLDLNDKFADNKQIIFTAGVNPTIKINRGLTIAPDAGKPAITAAGDLIITADADMKLDAKGAIEAKSLSVAGGANVEARADGEKAAFLAKNGTIMIGDSAAVTVNGAVEASGNITINGNASVVAKADRSVPALYAKSGTITVGGTATVIASNQSGAAMNPAPDTSSYTGLRMTASKEAKGKPAVDYQAGQISSYQYLKLERSLSLEEIEDSVGKLAQDAAPELVDALADQIRGLSKDERAQLEVETIQKVDQLLKEATDISPVTVIKAPEGLSDGKQIQNAVISGALLAADIMSADHADTVVELKIEQKQPENGAALTFECNLYVNGNKTALKVPVELTVELPPEFYPVRGYQIHHTGAGIDEWMDFIYQGADNTTLIRTDSFSTFSIVNTSGSSGSGGSGGGGGNGGGGSSGGSGGGGVSLGTAATAGPGALSGRWIQDAYGWWYQNLDNSYPKDGWARIPYAGKDQWYFFDKNGYMVTGWVMWNGSWYYMSTAADGTNGIMLTGWQTIDGKRYYFSEAIDGTAGIKLTNIQIGEYYLDHEGVARP